MAPRKPRTTEETPLARLPVVGISTPIGQLPTAQEERREKEWEDLVDQVGTDGRIRVWHIIEGKSIWAGEMTADGFSLDALMDTYGGGDYSLVFYQGKSKIDTLRVSLDPNVPIRNPRAPRPAAGVVGAPASTGLELFAPVMAAMSAMMAASANNSAEILRGVVAMMGARPPERDPMELVTKVLEVTKQQPSTTPATELFSVFEKGMTLANAMRGDDDGTLGLAREGLSVIGKIVEGQGKRTATTAALPAAPAPGASGPVGAGASVAGHIGNAPPSVDGAGDGSGGGTPGASSAQVVTRPWVVAAWPARTYLLMAMGQFRPDTVADMIADRLDEAAFNDLIQDIEAGTPKEFLDRFRGYFNIPAEQMDDNMYRWMLELVQSVKALVAEEEDLPPEPPAA